jgi:outer membrane receptor protein involved in Fe transport
MKTILRIFTLLFGVVSFAQTTVTGTVNDDSGMPLPGANIIVVGTSSGAISDFDGKFTLSVSQAPPFTIQASSVGFTSVSEEVSANNQNITFTLVEGSLLDEVVVSASRVPQRIFESPVTVEKYSIRQIQRTPSSDYFEGLQNVKGVQMNQTGLVFSQVNTRGFGTAYNEGFVTLVDGMNTQAPVFGFAVGNLIGINELDVQSVELLPGSASALYGMDAYKGIMSINSKSAFDHEGITAYYRTGATQQMDGSQGEFNDFGVRLATKLGDKWAVKATVSAKEGTEWAATDTRHKRECSNCGEGSIVEGYDTNAPDYDAVNEYGQQSFDSRSQMELVGLGGLTGLPNAVNYFDTVVTTGYMEQDLFGNEAKNVKGNVSVYYRPNDNSEFEFSSLVGTGEAPLPAGNARYNIKDFVVQMHKLEYNSGGFNARAYFTKEDAGDTTQSAALATSVANQQAGGIEDGWGGIYLGTFLGGAAQAAGFTPDAQGIFIQQFLGTTVLNDILSGSASFANAIPGGAATVAALHQAARANADANMIPVGTPEFDQAIANATTGALLTTNTGFLGARIQDVSEVYTFEANYDFEDKWDFANLIVGGLYRGFNLDTEGTLYTDYFDPITWNEFGVYAQMQKDLMNDDLSLTASMRYDKQSVMDDANVTPRIGLLYKLNDNSNIRVSAQVGYRNPTNQDKFIGVYNFEETLLGTTPDNIDRFGSDPLRGQLLENGGIAQFTGADVFANALNKSIWDNQGEATSENVDYVEAEKVVSYDIGYRYNSKDFTLDFNAYYSQYENYIGTNSVYVPFLTDLQTGSSLTAQEAMDTDNYHQFGLDANLSVPFNTYGVSVEAIKRFNSMYSMNLIYEYNNLDYDAPANSDFELSWNTPEHRLKLGFTANLAENTSFSANARYNSEYYYESSFIDATIRENTVLDAKFMFAVPALDNLQFELGGNNIAGRSYVSIPGSGQIGSLYYCGAKIAF